MKGMVRVAMMYNRELSEGCSLTPDFDKISRFARQGMGVSILPVVVQSILTKDVLLLGYTNRSAFKEVRDTSNLILWSTSRDERWFKGETSGQRFRVAEARINCEQNSLLYLVEPINSARICHTRNLAGEFRETCFYRKIDLKTRRLINLDK